MFARGWKWTLSKYIYVLYILCVCCVCVHCCCALLLLLPYHYKFSTARCYASNAGYQSMGSFHSEDIEAMVRLPAADYQAPLCPLPKAHLADLDSRISQLVNTPCSLCFDLILNLSVLACVSGAQANSFWERDEERALLVG